MSTEKVLISKFFRCWKAFGFTYEKYHIRYLHQLSGNFSSWHVQKHLQSVCLGSSSKYKPYNQTITKDLEHKTRVQQKDLINLLPAFNKKIPQSFKRYLFSLKRTIILLTYKPAVAQKVNLHGFTINITTF